jgi:hypothetical protein
MHPRTLGRAWLHSPIASREVREAEPPPPLVPRPLPFERGPQLTLVPTTEETIRQLGIGVHRLSREETAAWNAADESQRAEARRAMREAVRELGGGELRDHRGRLLERVD